MAIEEPQYSIEIVTDTYQIRNYAPVLVAETFMEESFGEAGNKAFRILADYIFGNNQAKAKIDMTAPVNQTAAASEKIDMTAPVNQIPSGKGYWVQFTMPSKYTMETIPRPNDDRVKLRLVPGRRVAAFRYTGSWSESRYQEKLTLFLAALRRDSVQTVGEPIFARYDSPFRLWFLRRNEILLEVC